MADKKNKGISDADIDKIVRGIQDGKKPEVLSQYARDTMYGEEGKKIDPRYPESGVTVQQLGDLHSRYGTSGVEIDPRGLPADHRALAGLAQTEQDKVAIYNKLFGPNNVRPIGDTGRYLIRITRNGKPVDVLDDEAALTKRDIADLSGYVPEVAASIATYIKAVPKFTPAGLMGHLGVAGLGAIVGQGTGGLKDIGLRYALGENIDLDEIWPRRTKAAVIETALGGVLPWGSQKVFNRLRPSGIAPATDDVAEIIAKEGTEASKRLEAAGIQAPLTAGESTGNRGIAEYEGLAEKVSRILQPTKRLRQQQDAALIKGQEAIPEMGTPMIGPMQKGQARPVVRTKADDLIGSKVSARMAILEKQAAEQAADSARAAVVGAEAQAKAAVGVDLGQSVVAAGKKIRSGLQGTVARKQAEVRKLYSEAEEARLAAGGDERFIVATDTAEYAEKIIAKETLVEEATEKATKQTGLLTKGGDPIEEVVETTTLTPIGWAVPAYKEAQSFVSLGGTPQTLEAMLEARAKFGEVIGRAQAQGVKDLGGGFSVKQAKEFYKNISRDIEQNLDELSPEVAEAYRIAQSEAKNLFQKYTSSKTVNQMRFAPEEGGLEEATDIIAYFTAGKRGKPDMLKQMKAVLDPADYNVLKQGILADMAEGASIRMANGTSVIDFRVLQKKLGSVHFELSSELLGGKKQRELVMQALDDFRVAQEVAGPKGILQSPVPVSADELSKLTAASSDPAMFKSVKASIDKSIALKNAQRAEYANEVTTAVRGNSQLSGDINPDEFIDAFILNQKNHKLVRQALDKLPPEMEEEISRQLVRRIFERSNDLSREAIGSLSAGKKDVITGPQLKTIMYGDAATYKIIREIVPKTTLEKMDTLLAYQLAIDHARGRAGQVGAFARDSLLSKPVESFGKVAMARVLFTTPMQSFLKKAASKPEALARFSGWAGRGMDRVLPAKTGAGRVIISSMLGDEVVELAGLWAEATSDLDDVHREAIKSTYLSSSGENNKISDEELAAEVEKIINPKAAQGEGKAKTTRAQRLNLRLRK